MMKTARATDPLGQRSMLEMSEQDLERGEGSKAEDNKLVGAAMGAVPKAIFAPPSDAEEAEQTEPSVLVRTQTASWYAARRLALWPPPVACRCAPTHAHACPCRACRSPDAQW